jgi:serine phosphatase RsbU (regulator of sigma subunit)
VSARVSRAGLEERLRDIQSITDAAMSRLDDHGLLAEVLERTKAVLHADTAAVLLLDFSSGELIATAAAGLEEEVRQGVRIPVGRGFAGRIAAEHQPVILDHVDHSTVRNPILLARGIRALMGVPLIASGEVIGVLHVGSLTARQFTSDDVELLQLAADRAATAVQSLMMREDRIAAEALQRSLLPSALPVADGAEMAVRYVPGEGKVGGDWYDVFTLPSGQLCVAIGDVTGSGLSAAVIMGRMRSALRAYALETADTAEVLARLDAKMQHFEPGVLATVLYAVFDLGLDRVHLCSAGHCPPVVASPGRPAKPADIPAGLLIGAVSGADRQVATLDITPGTLVCFYTDGLIERRGQPIDHGLTRLCQAVTAQPPDAACARVMAALVGSEPAPDDIALLMFRRSPPSTQRHDGERLRGSLGRHHAAPRGGHRPHQRVPPVGGSGRPGRSSSATIAPGSRRSRLSPEPG